MPLVCWHPPDGTGIARLRSPFSLFADHFVKIISRGVRYKRYKLGELKDFDSLFFPAKDNLLRIVANFEAKQGEKRN